MSLERNSRLTKQIGRFSIVGIINSIIGYSIIFGFMALGFSPYISNFMGYITGFFCSFFLNMNFVFSVPEKICYRMARFLVAFFAAYTANFGTLYFCLQLRINDVISQICAGIVYILVLFSFSRLWVFK